MQALSVRGHQGPVDLEALGHRGSGTAVSDAIAMGCGGDRRADLGQVVWTLSVVTMRQPCSALPHPRGAAASEVTGRTPLRGRDLGLWEQAPREAHRNLLRIDLVVFGLATLPRLHGEGMAEHSGGTDGARHAPNDLPRRLSRL